jgi:hypothetical protein
MSSPAAWPIAPALDGTENRAPCRRTALIASALSAVPFTVGRAEHQRAN